MTDGLSISSVNLLMMEGLLTPIPLTLNALSFIIIVISELLRSSIMPNIDVVMELITPRLNVIYVKLSYGEEEVKSALWQMHRGKSPGPDGFNPYFFQKYWRIVGPSISSGGSTHLNYRCPHYI